MSTFASIRLWVLIGLAISVVLAGNAHLISVSISSQPACVAHVRPGEGIAGSGTFSAAQSSCTPRKQGTPI